MQEPAKALSREREVDAVLAAERRATTSARTPGRGRAVAGGGERDQHGKAKEGNWAANGRVHSASLRKVQNALYSLPVRSVWPPSNQLICFGSPRALKSARAAAGGTMSSRKPLTISTGLGAIFGAKCSASTI